MAFERRWAELLFEAVLGKPLPDTRDYWHQLATRTPPYFGPGLRGAVHLLTFLPVTMREFRRPLFALSPEERLDCVERLNRDPRALVRQSLATAKILACFALFEGERP